MRIGLIDVDGYHADRRHRRSAVFPNLALMRIAAWHKSRGDSVAWWSGLERYDRVYMSKVFTFSPDIETVIDADEIIRGGTGYKDYGSLPTEIEATPPDYSMYPDVDYAIGFLTRGCIRACPWCIVPKKEGRIRPAATWRDIKRPDSKKIVFMDNNVLACDHGIQQIKDMGEKPVWVDFNQGLDARLINPTTAALLARLHWIRFVRLSCDTEEMIPVIAQATAYMREAGIAPSRFWEYMLVQDVEEAERRALALDTMGVTPFAQPYRDYDGGEPDPKQVHFANWCNKKAVFKSCTWQEYKNHHDRNRLTWRVDGEQAQ